MVKGAQRDDRTGVYSPISPTYQKIQKQQPVAYRISDPILSAALFQRKPENPNRKKLLQ